MKFIAVLALLMAQTAFALPIVCQSHEKVGDNTALRVKINEKISVVQNGQVWRLYLLGITSYEPAENLKRMYGSGDPTSSMISMNIVKDGAIYGYIQVKSPAANGHYEGKIRVGGILHGRIIPVQCTDEAIHGEVAP